ncbi:MAG: hypothetical protein KDA96_02755 [Planctomycetaceae bacterium]|nr:hypothetical protein [Planctomycetaceae bacterium]
MKIVGGCLLLLIAEQAYAHANLVQFPNHIQAAAVLIPTSLAAAAAGLILLGWGLISERSPAEPREGRDQPKE